MGLYPQRPKMREGKKSKPTSGRPKGWDYRKKKYSMRDTGNSEEKKNPTNLVLISGGVGKKSVKNKKRETDRA